MKTIFLFQDTTIYTPAREPGIIPGADPNTGTEPSTITFTELP